MKKKIIYAVSLLIIVLIIFFTWQIINWSKESIFLSVDFKNKFDEIQAYSGIVGFLLSFLSILFVIYTIVEQRDYFQKNIDLKELDELKLKEDFIEFSKFYLNDVIQDTNEFGQNIKGYFEKVLLNPLKNSPLIFSAKNSNKRFADLDNLQLFKSFTEKYDNGSKIYNDFLKYTDFYIEAKSELKQIFKNHSIDKFERKRELSYSLDEIMDMCSTTIEKFRIEFPNNFNLKPWHNLLNNFIVNYYEQINPEEETDLNILDQDVLKPFLNQVQQIRNSQEFEYNLQDIVLKLAKVRKMLFALTLDSQLHGKEFQNIYNQYYSSDSEIIKKINELQTKMVE